MRVSPSQIKLFKSCQRAWFYDRHAPRGEYKQTAAQQLGDDVQDHLDAFLEHGTIPPLGVTRPNKPGRIALAGLRHLPAPGPWNHIEYAFAVMLLPASEDGERVDLTGRMDCYVPTKNLVVDHKTTWSIEQYALTEEQFPHDPQRISYAYAHLEMNKLATLAITRWVYYQTKEPYYSVVREHTDTRESIDKRIVALKLVAEDMRRLREDRFGCTRDFSFCKAYGGCPHIEQCYSDEPEGHTMSVVEELRAKAAARKATTTPPVIDVPVVRETVGAPEPAPAEPEQSAGEPPAGEPAPAPKKRRGRPAGSKNKPKDTEPSDEAVSIVLDDAGVFKPESPAMDLNAIRHDIDMLALKYGFEVDGVTMFDVGTPRLMVSVTMSMPEEA